MSTTSPDEIRQAVVGATLTGYFVRTVAERADETAIRWRDPAGGEAAWTWAEWTWADYADRACRFAALLVELGIRHGDRVVLMLPNRPEFHVADLGVLLAGGTPVSIYNSSAPAQIEYLAAHCGARLAVVDERLAAGVRQARPNLPGLTAVIVVGAAQPPADTLAFDDLLTREPLDLAQAAGAVDPDDLATVIYTSGTTGAPKGVMIRHRNVCASLESWLRAMGSGMTGWNLISYMPMAHVAERTLFSHYMHVREGSVVTTCPDPIQLSEYLIDVRPDFVYCPPRILEKMRSAIYADSGPELGDALQIGLQVMTRRIAGLDVDEALTAAYADADRVLDPIRARIGLDRCRILLTGAAPTAPEVFDFFLALGLPLSECYGLSECTGGATWSPDRPRPGTVGPAVPGVEIRLAEDGEILLRGANVVSGYLDDPAATEAAFDPDGWLRTGDVGRFDEAGYLQIVDRKKDLIITSGGQNIAPSGIEGALKSAPLIGQACVIGEGRPYLTALIVPDRLALTAWAQESGVDPDDPGTAQAVRAEISRMIEEVNTKLARVEQIKRFAVLDAEWLPDSAELTPTMKLKRKGVEGKYLDVIDALYQNSKYSL